MQGLLFEYQAAEKVSIITISNPEMEAMFFDKFPCFEMRCPIMSEQLLFKTQGPFDNIKCRLHITAAPQIAGRTPALLSPVPLKNKRRSVIH